MEQRFTHTIRKVYHSLRPSEKKVADVLLSAEFDIVNASIQALSALANVSQPTIIRFANAVGCKGFRELKTQLMQEVLRNEEKYALSQVVGFPVQPGDKLVDVSMKVVNTHIKHMEDLLQHLSTYALIRAVEAIKSAQKIMLFAVENSTSVADDLKTKLLYMGFDVVYHADPYLQHISAQNLKKGDVAIGISYTGTSTITVNAMQNAKLSGATTISITNYETAVINQFSDIILSTQSEQFLYGNAIFSRCMQIAIVDMLYTGILITDYSHYCKQIQARTEQIEGFSYPTNLARKSTSPLIPVT